MFKTEKLKHNLKKSSQIYFTRYSFLLQICSPTQLVKCTSNNIVTTPGVCYQSNKDGNNLKWKNLPGTAEGEVYYSYFKYI